MKRVLIVTYYWPPTGGSGVQRWVKFAKYLPQFGWQPVIYTPENPERQTVDTSLLDDIPQEAEIIRRPIREPYGLYRKLLHKSNAQSEVTPLNSGKKTFRQKLMVWIRGNFFIPDPRIGWVKPSVRFLRCYLREHPVDVMVTTGPPQSMHLIGRGVKRATGLRWIADFRDPWTGFFSFKHLGLWPLAKGIHSRLEASVLNETDAVVCVTPLVAKDFQDKTTRPVYTVTNGYDESDFASPIDDKARDGSFTIVHTGVFASDGNPLNLWDALARICADDHEFAEALRIRLIGKVDTEVVDAIRSRGLSGNLAAEGYLPHRETILAQRTADILILPLRQEPELLKIYPGKVFEYLAARRPILGIGQETGVSADILKECRAGEMYEWYRTDEPERFVRDQWKLHLSGECCTMDSDIERYSRRRLTREMVGIFETTDF